MHHIHRYVLSAKGQECLLPITNFQLIPQEELTRSDHTQTQRAD